MGEKGQGILPKCRLTYYTLHLLHTVRLRHGNQRLYFPSEGRCDEDFFALKIRRLWPDANPQTWVPEASTLEREVIAQSQRHENIYIYHISNLRTKSRIVFICKNGS